MAIFTKAQFSKTAQARSGSKGIRSIVNEVKKFSKTSTTISVFLSHSHKDANMIEDTVAFLRTLGTTIYIDWMDDSMPVQTNAKTASIIKSKILACDKFIFLATNESIESKWCNWEIGIGDALKLNRDKMCLLPMSENQGLWTGSEYLRIYPYVEVDSPTDNIFRLTYPDGKQVWFDEWLKKS